MKDSASTCDFSTKHSIECNCECHDEGRNIMHCMPCCDGKCEGCGKYWVDLAFHQNECYHYHIKQVIKK